MKVRPLILSVQAPARAPLWDTGFAAQLLSLCEQAAADLLVLGEMGPGSAAPDYDAQLVAAWMAPRTRGVGLVASVSSMHSEPFHVARAMSAVDFLSGGRSGWWPSAACADWARFGGVGQVSAAQQAGKAREFVAATQSLWDSWDADALIIDQTSGEYLYPDRVRRSDYRGEFHQVQGPLNAARPPQGHPVLVQDDRDEKLANLPADLRIVDADRAAASRGERLLARAEAGRCVGPPLEALLQRHAAGAIHGLHLTVADPLADLSAFVATTLPLLRERGLVAMDDRSQMLRKRLDLPIPQTRAEAARTGSRG